MGTVKKVSSSNHTVTVVISPTLHGGMMEKIVPAST